MEERTRPPSTYDRFSERFPKLRQAWDAVGEAGKEGPLDEKTLRLVKLGIAIGAQHEGAVHASIRKARALGISREEVEQVITLSAGTIGMPFVVAVYSWITDLYEKK
jgi:4-carboxymuconolactone decarboxylase